MILKVEIKKIHDIERFTWFNYLKSQILRGKGGVCMFPLILGLDPWTENKLFSKGPARSQHSFPGPLILIENNGSRVVLDQRSGVGGYLNPNLKFNCEYAINLNESLLLQPSAGSI